jgi:predicted Zn-dependent peptidase
MRGARDSGGEAGLAPILALCCLLLTLPLPARADPDAGPPPDAGAPPPAAAAQDTVQHLAGGTDLILLSRPGVTQGSFRFIVRSGGAADPTGRAGLAHVLEHLIFHGSQATGGDALDAAVRRAGGFMNGHTSENATTFELDAPRDALLPLAGKLIEVVSSPALWSAPLKPEMGVVQSESELREGANPFWNLIDATIFPASGPQKTVIGSTASLGAIGLEDAISFYQHEYLTSNITLVFAGDFSIDRVRETVAASLKLPPALPDERVSRPMHRPAEVPANISVKATASALLIGYELDDAGVAACPPVAQVAELRLLPLMTRDLDAAGISAVCTRVRQDPFLFILASGTVDDTTGLMELADKALDKLTKEPISPHERDVVQSRLAQLRLVREREPTQLTEAIADAVTQDGLTAENAVARVEHPPEWTPQGVMDFAKRLFVKERRVAIQVRRN